MRKFIFLILIIGVILFLHANQDAYFGRYAAWLIPKIYEALPAQNSPIGPYAVRIIGTLDNEPVAEVDVVSGSRWRIETTRGRMSRVVVVVCDGSKISSNTIGCANSEGDPRSVLNRALSEGPKIAAEARASHRDLVAVDGHMCVEMSNFGISSWIDSTTGFPVRVNNPSENRDGHYSRIPIDFTRPVTEELFDTRNTEPFFTKYLTQ
jgi:hypothetical protein